MEFHQNLKLLREKRGMTQEELAEQLGITRQSISKWELGINEPDLPTIRSLCRILDCSFDALLGEEKAAPTVEEPEEAKAVEAAPAKAGYRVHVPQLVCFIVYGFLSLIFAFFPFLSVASSTRPNFFSIIFTGNDNMNLVCLLLFVIHLASLTSMGLLAFLSRRYKWLIQLRNGLLFSETALALYVFVFGFIAASVDFGLAALFLNHVVFLVLHLSLPSLKSSGFAKKYGENTLISSAVDRYVLPSVTMIALALLGLIRLSWISNFTVFDISVFWLTNIISFAGLVTFAVLFLALPERVSRRGIKVGALITLGVTLLFGFLFCDRGVWFLLLFYWIDVIGVFIAVILCKVPKNEAESLTDHEKTCQGA